MSMGGSLMFLWHNTPTLFAIRGADNVVAVYLLRASSSEEKEVPASSNLKFLCQHLPCLTVVREQRKDFQADCFGESHILSPASGGNVTVILLGSSAIIFVTSGQSTAFGYHTLSACERQIAVTNAIVSYLVL